MTTPRLLALAACACLWQAPPAVHAAPQVPPSHYTFAIDEDGLRGLPDQSALNTPIDARARVVVRQARFYRVGTDLRPGTTDDERLRLFGINLSFDANFPSADTAPALARRLRRLGINIVRLHHLDTSPGEADPPASLLRDGAYPSFNADAVTRLRTLIQALGREGIYVNLNLRVGYPFGPRDGIPDFDRRAMKRPNASPIAVYHPTLVALQERYARETIDRLGLRDNPALAMVEISNEASLLAAWARQEWADAVPPGYRDTLRGLWRDWLAARHGSAAQACQAWGACLAGDDAPELPTPTDAFPVRRGFESLRSQVAAKLPGAMGRMVAGGNDPALLPDSREAKRLQDFLAFLADTDRAYFERLRRVVHEAAGFPVATTGTQAGYGGILNLGAQAGMDYIDDHTYVSHPDFPNGFGDVRNWRIWHDSLTNKDMDGKLLALAFLRDAGKPYVLSEFNHPFPGLQGAEIIPITAIVAALQDWDGIFFFDYADGSTWPTAPWGFGLRGDWGKYVLASQSAWLFRSGHLAPLAGAATIPMPAATQVALAASPARDALARHLAQRYGVVPALAWTHRLAMDTRPEARPPAPLAPPAAPYASPDGAVAFDPARQVLTLRTPQALGVFGRIPDAPAGAGLAVARRDAPVDHVSILLTAGDGLPVENSARLLLSLGGQTVGTQPGSKPPRPKNFVPHPSGKGSWTLEPDPLHGDSPSGSRYSQAPAWIAASPVTVSWPTRQRAVRVYPLDGAGRRQAALPPSRVRVSAGRISVDVQATPAETSPWYAVEADDGRP